MSITGSLYSFNELPSEIKLKKILEEEEGDMIVMEFCKDLINNVMDKIEANDLTNQAQNFVVNCATEAIRKAVEVYYCQHNVSYTDMGKESWLPDELCKPSPCDSWAAYRTPVNFQGKSSDLDNEEHEKTNISDEIVSRDDLNDISSPAKVSISQSSASQEEYYSITEYLEDILSTSSDEEEIEESASRAPLLESATDIAIPLNTKLNSKLSEVSGKPGRSENNLAKKSIEQEGFILNAFSKTVLGETDKGLCVPHVANVPVSTVVKEIPDVEEFTLVREKRRTKVSKKAWVSNLPRRRSDTKIKMTKIEDDPPKDKSLYKRK